MEDYGLFMEALLEDWQFHRVRGLIDISKLSWHIYKFSIGSKNQRLKIEEADVKSVRFQYIID